MRLTVAHQLNGRDAHFDRVTRLFAIRLRRFGRRYERGDTPPHELLGVFVHAAVQPARRVSIEAATLGIANRLFDVRELQRGAVEDHAVAGEGQQKYRPISETLVDPRAIDRGILEHAVGDRDVQPLTGRGDAIGLDDGLLDLRGSGIFRDLDQKPRWTRGDMKVGVVEARDDGPATDVNAAS